MDLAEKSQMGVFRYLTQLIDRDELDASGRPAWTPADKQSRRCPPGQQRQQRRLDQPLAPARQRRTPDRREPHDARLPWAPLVQLVAGGGPAHGLVRVSRDGGRSYPRSRERPVTAALPNPPAAVRLHAAAGYACCVVADLDIKKKGQAQVDPDRDVLPALLGRCGGFTLTGSSPTCGRHLYLPLLKPVPHEQVRLVMHAHASLLPSLDVAPDGGAHHQVAADAASRR